MKGIDDVAHVLWGILIGVSMVYLDPWLAAVVIMVPRELEQTREAIRRSKKKVNWENFKARVNRKWALGKMRDLVGFAVGAAIVQALT